LKVDGGDAGTDGGDPSWVSEWTDNDPTYSVTMTGIDGTASDDVWFWGTRGTGCGVILHKTSAGYELVADGAPSPTGGCNDAGRYLNIAGDFGAGTWAPSRNVLVGLQHAGEESLQPNMNDNDLIRIRQNVDGSYSSTVSHPGMDVLLTAVWGTSEDDLWLIAKHKTQLQSWGAGAVLRATNAWQEGSSYDYSTIALNNAPNNHSLLLIRGTFNTDLWVVGDERAFHKTIP